MVPREARTAHKRLAAELRGDLFEPTRRQGSHGHRPVCVVRGDHALAGRQEGRELIEIRVFDRLRLMDGVAGRA